jgi:hypothetical protein
MQLLAFVLLLLDGAALCAQDTSRWRYWQVADGFKESYTVSLGVDASGNVWARQSIAAVSLLNGYSVVQLPRLPNAAICEPRPTARYGTLVSEDSAAFRMGGGSSARRRKFWRCRRICA